MRNGHQGFPTTDERFDICGIAVIRLTSSIRGAGAAERLREMLATTIDHGARRLVLDVSEVEAIDIGGVGVLVAASKRIGSSGEIALCGPSPALRRLLDVTMMDRMLTVCDTCEDGVEALGGPEAPRRVRTKVVVSRWAPARWAESVLRFGRVRPSTVGAA